MGKGHSLSFGMPAVPISGQARNAYKLHLLTHFLCKSLCYFKGRSRKGGREGRHGTEQSDCAGSNRAGGPLAKDWHVGICGVKFSVKELIGPLYLIWNSKKKKKDAVSFPCPGLLTECGCGATLSPDGRLGSAGS